MDMFAKVCLIYQECYEREFIPICAKCNLAIQPDPSTNKLTAIEWAGQKYHVSCFGCSVRTELKRYVQLHFLI
jgi:hypothetical protein